MEFEVTSTFIYAIVAIIILLTCSALMSASEVAFFGLSLKDKNKFKNSGLKSAKRVISLLEKPDWLLATILISNNFVNVFIVIISTYLTAILCSGIDNEILIIIIEMVLVTFILLLFCEVSPKILATQQPAKFAKFMSLPLLILTKILYPVNFVLIKSTNFINRKVEKIASSSLSVEELSRAIELASDELKDDKNVLEGFINSSDLEVKEIMTNRINVFAVEYNSKFTEILSQIIEAEFSRIPVYINNLDNIKGILYIKDVLPYINLNNKDDFKWQKLIRPHYIVPETKKIHDLLFDFQNKKLHIAIIVDEYGGVGGLITLEDILEEFVGEIHDESDAEDSNFQKLNNNTYEFDAKYSIVDFCKTIGADYQIFQEKKGDADSLAGLILEVHGEIPKINTNIVIDKYSFTITSADKRRINKIKVNILEEDKNETI